MGEKNWRRRVCDAVRRRMRMTDAGDAAHAGGDGGVIAYQVPPRAGSCFEIRVVTGKGRGVFTLVPLESGAIVGILNCSSLPLFFPSLPSPSPLYPLYPLYTLHPLYTTPYFPPCSQSMVLPPITITLPIFLLCFLL